jgi:tetratricopeptide (TPR) repeat protein
LGAVLLALLKGLSGALAVLTGVAGLLIAEGARAQSSSGSDLQRQYDAAFQEMMNKPADLEVLFKFATLAAQTGDLEGAISALERMLLVSPDLPRVRLELGVLYYRLKSYEVARTYLEGTLASAGISDDVRSRAQEYLALSNKNEKPSQFSGEFFFGWRFQSDANLGPPTSTVRLFGSAANINQTAVGSPDWGIVGSMTLRHRYDFGRQDRSALETQFTAYSNRQFTLTTANVSLFDLTSGPRFQIFDGIFEDVSLKPLFTGGYIMVNDTSYYVAYGGGLEARALLRDGLRNTTTAIWRRQAHPDTWYLPTNSDYTGMEYTGTTTFQYEMTPLISVFAGGNAQRFETDQTPSLSYQLWGVSGGLNVRFADPIFKTGQSWTVGLTYSYQWWLYDAPDPTVDPNVINSQLDSILSVVLSIPLDDRTNFTLTGGRFVRSSNLPNYAFENDSVMFGVTWRF